jgi:hypothetical protein
MKAVFTIEQVEDKMVVTIEAAEIKTVERQEKKPMDADQIAKWVMRHLGGWEQIHLDMVKHINDLVNYEVNKAKQ